MKADTKFTLTVLGLSVFGIGSVLVYRSY